MLTSFNWRSKDFSPVFSSVSFIGLVFIYGPIILLELIYICGKGNNQGIFFSYECPIIPKVFVE